MRPIPDRRIFDSIDLLLAMQCGDGGFAAYEKIRGPKFLELINPAEVFGERFLVNDTTLLIGPKGTS